MADPSALPAQAAAGRLSPAPETPEALRPDAVGLLRVRIRGLRSDQGLVKIALYGSEDSYDTRRGSFRKAELPIKGRACEWWVDGLPSGDYAVMFYHDANGNRRFDRNRLGLPTESYGFSNNARPRLGLPAYHRIKFAVDEPLTNLELVAQPE